MLNKALTDRANAIAADKRLRLQDMITKALEAGNDLFKEKREARRLCLGCYYLGSHRIVGHGFTPWKCAGCGAEGMHSNTGVPLFCTRCADDYDLCVDCGVDRELRFRRKITKLPKRMRARKGGA
jgi:hypothetical protein